MRYANAYAYDKPSVLIPRKGSLGNLFYVDVPFWNVDMIFYTEIDESQMLPKFLYFFLATADLGEMNQAGGIPSQTQSVLNELRIPVPPLEIQREIVKVLDNFTELEARRRQYQYYRNALLTFESPSSGGVPEGRGGMLGELPSRQASPTTPPQEGNKVRWATLGEICVSVIHRRNGFRQTA